ncbi:AAA family ATPase [Streptococcus oralis]|uniref:AAA family ATPase n=1 Tax=Streptococcus oralis TaxID=1303 RepID=UPI002001A18E|nr:AAA family ATPase [Streptococcus oralis]
MENNRSSFKYRLNYSNEIESVHCVVGENGSGKTRLINSLLEKDEYSIAKFYQDTKDILAYSFVKYSASVELNKLQVNSSGSIDISTSAYLNTMDLVNLNREDSIKQVKVVIDYYKKGNKNTKWQNLIELSDKRVFLRLNQIGEGIISYNKYYLKGNNLNDEWEKKLKEIIKYVHKEKNIIKVLLRKFFAVFSDYIVFNLSREQIVSLINEINPKTIQPTERFYLDLNKFLNGNTKSKITQLRNFFNDLSTIISNVGRNFIFTKDDDRKTLEDIFKGLNTEESDNLISQETFSVLEFAWNGLSSGELALLNLLGRLNSIKSNLSSKILVLLDEVDLGLHPEWQRNWVNRVLPIIGKIMKKRNGAVRVILSTHSPIILSDFLAEDVIYLPEEPNKKLKTFGQNIYSLFKNSFFLEAPKGAFSQQVIEDLLKIFGNSSNDVLIQERAAYEEFISKYGLQFDKETPGYEVREFFEELINMIGEDIIRNHLKKQIKKVRWNNDQNDRLDYEKKIEKLEEQIKELKEKILKPEEENND